MMQTKQTRFDSLANLRHFLSALMVASLFITNVVAQDSQEGDNSSVDQSEAKESEVRDDVPAAAQPPTTPPESVSEDEEAALAFYDIPWKLRPYRVKVSLAYGEAPSLTKRFQQNLQATLKNRIAGVLGPYWQCEFEINHWLRPANHVTMERSNSAELTNRFRKDEFDKVLLICLENEHKLAIAGWEWDANSQSRSPVLRRSVVDRRLIADEVFDLLMDLFRPVAMINSTEGETAELVTRGGELLAAESVEVLPKSGDLMTAHFRYLTREGEVRSVQSVPWTYLRVDGIERSRLDCGVETAFATALTGSRRRVELMAIRARPVFEKTKLRLVPRTNPNMPLVGVRARVFDELPSESNPDPHVEDLMTDRFGTVTVSTDLGVPVKRLLVHSGGAVLANLPFVAGLDRQATLEVPDDAARLEVEGNLAMIQGELIDLVSRRAVMLARALSMARAEKWDEQESIMSEVDKLPGTSYFQSKIIAVRVPGVERAQANKDRAAEKRINKMAAELEELVTRHLDPTAVRDVKAEIKELRELADRANS